MWKSLRSTSHGGFSVRSILTFALAALLTVFFAATSLSPSYAASDTASWNGQSITYNGDQFTEVGTSAKGDGTGVPAGNTYYEYSASSTSTTAEVIYYTSDADTDQAVTATYAVYDVDSTTSPPSLTNAHDSQKITIDGGSKQATYCAISSVGWFVCPISNFLAGGLDAVFGFLTQFVKVQPVNVTDTSNPLFVGWNMMRAIANVAFIIAFIFIIYSQLTSLGISNYSLKKLLPRLIIAAILVNISYYLAAVCVDLSNIVGMSIQDFFSSLASTAFHSADGSSNSPITFAKLMTFIVSGGTIGLGVGIGALAFATGGTALGLLFLVLPAVAGLILTLLMVLLILAARQALIVILIIVAPVAFVAYLLPNTEKWFNRWRELFMAMLIFFPAFSLVYAGAQLAGNIIMMNASSIIILILGMIVQLAPLVITPWLLKLSTGALGNVARLIQNTSNKSRSGLKGWAGRNREYHRQRGFSYNPRKADGTMKKTRYLQPRHWATGINNWGRDLEENTNNAKTAASNVYHERERYGDIHEQAAELEMDKSRIENAHKLHIQEHINDVDSTLHVKNVRLEAGKVALDAAMKETTATVEEYKTTRVAGLTGELAKHNQDMRANALTATIQSRRAENAQHIQSEELRNSLLANDNLRMEAGGIAGVEGANSVLATAVSAERQAYNKTVGEARAIIKHFNLSSQDRQDFALGASFQRVDSSGHSFHFDPTNNYLRDAAIEDQLATGTVDQINQIVMRSGSSLNDFRTTISQAVADNKLGARTIYLGGKTIDDIAQGRIKSETDLNRVALETIAKGKISERDLSNADQEAVEKLANMAENAFNAFNPTKVTTPETATILTTIQTDSPKLYTDLGNNRAGNLVDFSKLAQDTLTGDDRVYVKPNAKKHILRVAQLTEPDFDPEIALREMSTPNPAANPQGPQTPPQNPPTPPFTPPTNP